jgi:hypothetical protein
MTCGATGIQAFRTLQVEWQSEACEDWVVLRPTSIPKFPT